MLYLRPLQEQHCLRFPDNCLLWQMMAYLPWKTSEFKKFKVLVVMKCICNSSKPGSFQSEMTMELWDTTMPHHTSAVTVQLHQAKSAAAEETFVWRQLLLLLLHKQSHIVNREKRNKPRLQGNIMKALWLQTQKASLSPVERGHYPENTQKENKQINRKVQTGPRAHIPFSLQATQTYVPWGFFVVMD